MKRFYTYILRDPRNNQPFYVGKGTKDRYKSHIREATKHPKTHKDYTILAIIREGLEVVYQLSDLMFETEALELETLVIEEIGSSHITTIKDGPLTNLIEGGSQPPTGSGKDNNFYGKHHTKSSIDQMIKSRNANPTWMASVSASTPHSTRTLISESNKKTKNDPKWIEEVGNKSRKHQSLSLIASGKVAGANNPKAKRIMIFDSSFNLIADLRGEYQSFIKEHKFPKDEAKISINTLSPMYSGGKRVTTNNKKFIGWYVVEIPFYK